MTSSQYEDAHIPVFKALKPNCTTFADSLEILKNSSIAFNATIVAVPAISSQVFFSSSSFGAYLELLYDRFTVHP